MLYAISKPRFQVSFLSRIKEEETWGDRDISLVLRHTFSCPSVSIRGGGGGEKILTHYSLLKPDEP